MDDARFFDNRARTSNLDFLSNISVDILSAEIQRRQDGNSTRPSCGSSRVVGAYNVGAHVFALFLILIISTLACSFPIIARRFPELPIPHRFLFLSRHFGTGVLIATAFVHLLPTAFISMTNPCLPPFWNQRYQPMAGFIAMISVFAVVTIEMVFASRGAGHTHESEWSKIPDETPAQPSFHDDQEDGTRRVPMHSLISPIPPHEEEHNRDHEYLSTGEAKTPPPQPRHQDSDSESDLDLQDLDAYDPVTTSESTRLNQENTDPANAAVQQRYQHQPTRPTRPRHDSGASATNAPPQDPSKMFLQCLLLEAGILFHSIFIGMAVSVAQGTQFVVLLIAISFHQTFEGFALGARIAALIPALFDASSPKPWLMALAYGTTTPIGQAIGLWLHRLYDPNSEVGLLMVGITNAISSGLLLFAGLVQLIAEDFLSDRSYQVLRGRRRIEACLAVALGGLLMAVVGAFA